MPHIRYSWAFLLVLTTAAMLLVAPSSGVAREASEASYTNPVSEGTVDAFPDPVIIRAKDGYWYAYSTQQQTPVSRIAIIRSQDMVHWEYVGDVFTDANRPRWHRNTELWAPDIRYLNGKYYLYYSVASLSFVLPYTIGVATAPTPTGPWTDSGGPVIPPQGACDTFTNIDPAQFTDNDGSTYLYWGSFRNLCVGQLNDAGTRVVGEVTEVYTGPAEGPYVVRHGDYYYLFVSEAACCSAGFSSYQVKVGRSKSPRGPFVDREGVPMTAANTNGTFVLSANGNKWVGTGHHSQATDLSGQDWIIYHAVDRTRYTDYADYPGLGRKLLIDRLDWIDGWPTVRAGKWASENSQPAPVSEWSVGGDFNDKDSIDDWRQDGAADGWRLQREDGTNQYVQAPPTGKATYLISAGQAPTDMRAEADLRLPAESTGAIGVVAAYRDDDNHIRAWLDAGKNALVTEMIVNGRSVGQEHTPLPEGFDFHNWHNVALEIREQHRAGPPDRANRADQGTRSRSNHGRPQLQLSVEVTDARLGDPLATQERMLRARPHGSGAVGVVSRQAGAQADNIGAATLYEPAQPVGPPDLGALDPALSDEFNDGINPGSPDDPNPWSWVREPTGNETDGAFHMPTEGELALTANDASVLVRDAPAANYTVETKLHFEPDRSTQQAGLVVYAGDDQYVKLVTELGPNGGSWDGPLAQTEFAKENSKEPPGIGLTYGSNYIGPPDNTVWLRLSHRIDPDNGEHEYCAGTSRDRENWVWGGVWTLPAGAIPKIGLVSMNTPGAVAEFDYVRTYRPHL